VLPDKLKTPRKYCLGIVIQCRDVITVGKLPHLKLAGWHRRPQQPEAGRPDDMVGVATVRQDRLPQIREVLLSDAPQPRQRRRGLDRNPVVPDLAHPLFLDVAGDALERRHDQLERRGQQEQPGVGGDGRVDQNQPADRVAPQLGQPQREAAAHRQAHHEHLVAALLQLVERPVYLGVPVLPPGSGHLLPGGAVPRQPRQRDAEARGRQVVRPWPQ
jgi:hypothetical protein